jgi:hypothetical protein
MKGLMLLLVTFLAGNVVLGQYEKYRPVKFLETNSFMSTYNLADNVQAKAQIRAQAGAAILEEALINSSESAWPEGISTLDNRNKNRSLMNSYNGRYVSDVETNSCMILITPAENKHMELSLIPTKNIYFILSKESIEFISGNKQTSVVSSPSVSFPTNFNGQVLSLLADFETDFENVIGDKLPAKNEFDVFVEYDSKIKLEGAVKCYFPDNFASHNTFVADFGDYKSYEEGKVVFDKLVAKINNISFKDITFVSNESNLDNLWTNYWLPFNLSGKMSPKMEKVLMEVQMIKLLAFDEKFNTYDSYSLIFRISKQDQ